MAADLDVLLSPFRDNMNGGVKVLGLNRCVSVWRKFTSRYEKETIVSVGSGNGFLEMVFEKMVPRKILCVDPDPLSFVSETLDEPFRAPDFALCIDLEIHGDNKIMLINWSSPNESTYDADAVTLLRPRAILTITEEFMGESGAAGSLQLFALLYHSGQYRKVNQVHANDVTGHLNCYMQWWERTDIQPPSHWELDDGDLTPTRLPYEDNSCVCF